MTLRFANRAHNFLIHAGATALPNTKTAMPEADDAAALIE
jgi:hypothetical protein